MRLCKPLPRKGSEKWFLRPIWKITFTAFFLLAICLNASAEGYAQEINLSEKDASLEKVFKQIHKQTGYTFVYTESVLKKGRNVSLAVKNAGIDEVLEACFKDQDITYTILNKMVVIKEKGPLPAKENVLATPPPIDISGKVTDEKDGVPAVTPDYLRVWRQGDFAFMDYGKDASNPKWIKLRHRRGPIYDPEPNDNYYREVLGN